MTGGARAARRPVTCRIQIVTNPVPTGQMGDLPRMSKIQKSEHSAIERPVSAPDTPQIHARSVPERGARSITVEPVPPKRERKRPSGTDEFALHDRRLYGFLYYKTIWPRRAKPLTIINHCVAMGWVLGRGIPYGSKFGPAPGEKDPRSKRSLARRVERRWRAERDTWIKLRQMGYEPRGGLLPEWQ